MGREQLARACLRLTRIDDQTRLCPGWDLARAMMPEQAKQFPINGAYGMQMILSGAEGTFSFAHIGFEVTGGWVVIMNSPQGLTRQRLDQYPQNVRKAAFARLRDGGFRDHLMGKVIEMTDLIGVRGVKGVSAHNHDKVDRENNIGTLPLEHALRSMDLLYQRHGFVQDPSRNYYLRVDA